jgi:hypothetical protein
MGLIELVVTVCTLMLPNRCEDQHFSFSADMSLKQCVLNAQPYIAQWINEHPKWDVVRWRCKYGGIRNEETNLRTRFCPSPRGVDQGFDNDQGGRDQVARNDLRRRN